MMIKLRYLFYFSLLVAGIACSPAGGEKRGHEFMPDMVHSTAYEANLYDYYYYNTWGSEEDYKNFVMPRKSVTGTIARGAVHTSLIGSPKGKLMASQGFDGTSSPTAIAESMNGSVPYPYGDTEEERVRASQEIISNPFPITERGLAEGQQLYTIYCGICHGTKGDGAGYLVREADPAKGIIDGVYPAAPANFLRDVFIDTTAGFFYHSIMYGKNVMGAYADKLSYEERWNVIHYIRSLQAKSVGKVYSADANTLNGSIPGAGLMAELEAQAVDEKPATDESNSDQEHHNQDQNNSEGHNEGGH